MDIYTAWVWPCLIMGILMTAAISRPLFQKHIKPLSITTLPAHFFTRIALPFYMIHQFEEHGYDLLGRPYQFIVFSCEDVMKVSLQNCPMSPRIVFYINVALVWGTGIAAYLDERGSGAGANFIAFEFINALVHFAGSVQTGTLYNPGFATAAVLFVPIFIVGFRALVRDRKLNALGIARALAVGTLTQGIIMVCFGLIAKGIISDGTACFIQVLNILPIVLITRP